MTKPGLESQSPSHHASPEVIARGIWIRGGRVLVCRSVSGGYAYLPGGHVEPGETAAEALVREFEEEAGLRIEAGPCVVVSEVIFGQPPRTGGHELNLVFLVEHRSGDDERPQIASREPHIAFEWIELAAVVDTDLRPRSIRAWIVGGGGDTHEPTLFHSDRES